LRKVLATVHQRDIFGGANPPESGAIEMQPKRYRYLSVSDIAASEPRQMALPLRKFWHSLAASQPKRGEGEQK
jgi:hypothetical protein